MLSSVLQQVIQHKLGEGGLQFSKVSGGSINETYRVETSVGRRYFCKCNSATKFPHLFEGEIVGLTLISSHGIIRTPSVIGCFEAGGQQVLLLEWIEECKPTNEFWKLFGEQIARLHHVTADQFGFATSNYMGAVPQVNNHAATWSDFFRKNRLTPLADKCHQQELLTANHLSQLEKLYAKLDTVFDVVNPALLHGDLWSGNFLCHAASLPVVIDPAVYFGHRSMDLAMTTLFGGFDASFYDSYQYHFPLPANFREQWEVCNLYPLLIHLYLFGKSYLPQIQNIFQRFS
ncbi:MAG: fructosamine kinase family protein [Flaviaesturariibacter sp.]|nr:fructosamine kinase family protein [Flaviaesturariibacter sp.]